MEMKKKKKKKNENENENEPLNPMTISISVVMWHSLLENDIVA